LRKAVARQHLAQAVDDVGIAVEVGEQSYQLSALSLQPKRLAISSWHFAGQFFESSRITLNSCSHCLQAWATDFY
jgi:hypothetical protein